MNFLPVIDDERIGAGDTERLLNFQRIGGLRRMHTDAFSLVEIVIAIGIVSFAFVGIFGLLPVGMNTFRQAMDTSVSSQIVQRVVNEAQQTDFATLTDPATQGKAATRYFDDQGNEVAASGDSIYTVEVIVTAPTPLPNATSSASLATVSVKIAANPGHNTSPFASTSKLPYSAYSAFIARNQ